MLIVIKETHYGKVLNSPMGADYEFLLRKDEMYVVEYTFPLVYEDEETDYENSFNDQDEEAVIKITTESNSYLYIRPHVDHWDDIVDDYDPDDATCFDLREYFFRLKMSCFNPAMVTGRIYSNQLKHVYTKLTEDFIRNF